VCGGLPVVEAEFFHDEDMPEWCRGMGWWANVWLFDPEFPGGNEDFIFASDLDTVFLRDLGSVVEWGQQSPVTGNFNFGGDQSTMETGVLSIERASGLARNVWVMAEHAAFQFHPRVFDAPFIAKALCDCDALFPLDLVSSYKEKMNSYWINRLSILCFHGWPKPHHVLADPTMPLHGLVKEYWRPDG
jgi:hypothetical protein